MPSLMHDRRAHDAIARIERALARVEQGVDDQESGNPAELERLRRANERLRQRVEGAVSEIDRILDAEGGR